MIDYGSPIWGTREYTCINAVQNRAGRFFLGVGKYTPNIAVNGDIGWSLPITKQWLVPTYYQAVEAVEVRFETLATDELNGGFKNK